MPDSLTAIISAIVNENDRIGIIGENGAGKTTLLNMLMGILENDEGDIIVADNVTIGYLAGYEENRPELKVKHVTPAMNAPDVDPIALLTKDEQIMLMCYRVLQNDKKQEILKYIKNLTVSSEE